MNKILGNKKIIFLLMAPGLAVFIFAIFVPIILSIYYGMTQWSGMGIPKFIGLKNFTELLFNDSTFWISLRNAGALALGLVFIQHPLCMLFAIMLNKLGGIWEKIFRAICFVPCVISIIVTSKMWVSIYDPQYGLLNKVLDILGLGAFKQQWLGNPNIVLFSVLVIIMWQGFGWGMLIYYAGLKGIPDDMYEAAKIDGAGSFRMYLNIILPLMNPVIKINVTLAVISALKQMETIYLTTNGGPGQSSQFLANYLYIKAFTSFEYGYGNAISVLFIIACLVATVMLNKIFKQESIEY